MSGYIVHRPDRPKPYLARFQPHGARMVSKSFATKRRAEEWLKTQQVDRNRGEWSDPRAGRMLFSEQAERWMSSRRQNRRTTAARDETLMRIAILYHLGDKPLTAINTETIEEWIGTLSTRYSPATTRKAFQLASGVLEAAVRARRLPRNPAAGVKLPAIVKVERRFLTVDEIQALADAIDPRYRLLVLLGAYAGLRLGELAALKVSSFGIGYRTLTITETLTDVRGVLEIGPPKTRASIRTVALPAFLSDDLATMVVNEQLLFPAPAGGPIRVSTWRRRFWAPAVEKAGLEWCTPHALRHSQVALLVQAGEQPSTIAKRLGHTSVKTVLDVYGHLYEGADQAAAEKLDAISRTSRAPSRVVDIGRVRKTQ